MLVSGGVDKTIVRDKLAVVQRSFMCVFPSLGEEGGDSKADFFVRTVIPSNVKNYKIQDFVSGYLLRVNGLIKEDLFEQQEELMDVLIFWLKKCGKITIQIYGTYMVIYEEGDLIYIKLDQEGSPCVQTESAESLVDFVRKNAELVPEKNETILFDIKNAVGLVTSHLWITGC